MLVSDDCTPPEILIAGYTQQKSNVININTTSQKNSMCNIFTQRIHETWTCIKCEGPGLIGYSHRTLRLQV